MPFDTPGDPSAQFRAADHNGELLIIEVNEVIRQIPTVNGPADAVRATVTVVDGDQAGAIYPDTLVWGKVLNPQLASKVGKTVLGRLGQGQAKPGQTAPWILEAAGDDDTAKAEAFLAQHAKGLVGSMTTANDPANDGPF